MKIMAIDPGTLESAYVVWDSYKEEIEDKAILPNEHLERFLRNMKPFNDLVIERIDSYGMPVGAETFTTCIWIGRFMGAYGGADLIGRKEVKKALCGSLRAKDKDIRAILIKSYGKPGTKKEPGKMYGMKSHLWSALAVAVAYEKIIKSQESS